jgi:hypothetical protein
MYLQSGYFCGTARRCLECMAGLFFLYKAGHQSLEVHIGGGLIVVRPTAHLCKWIQQPLVPEISLEDVGF